MKQDVKIKRNQSQKYNEKNKLHNYLIQNIGFKICTFKKEEIKIYKFIDFE